jgi:hypothetical protein
MSDPEKQPEEAIMEPAPEQEPAAETTEPPTEEATPEPAPQQEPAAEMTKPSTEEEAPSPAPEVTEQAPEAPPVETAAGDEEAPPPAPEAQETSMVAPSPPEAGESGDDPKPKPKPPKEKNAKFKELEETGAWGSVSKKEKYVAIGVFALIIIVVIVVVSVLVSQSEGEEIIELPPTKAPTAAPTDIQTITELDIVLDAIEVSDYTYTLIQYLPFVRSYYEGLQYDSSATPQERAMAWLLYEDERDRTGEVALRWVLACLYYHHKGINWKSSEGWLSGAHICEWEHVLCDFNNEIQELILSNNNLVGFIPNELIMLGGVQAIWYDENQMTGTIPGDMLGSMPKLSFLYLNDNQFTGTIPASLDKDGHLSKYFFVSFFL